MNHCFDRTEKEFDRGMALLGPLGNFGTGMSAADLFPELIEEEVQTGTNLKERGAINSMGFLKCIDGFDPDCLSSDLGRPDLIEMAMISQLDHERLLQTMEERHVQMDGIEFIGENEGVIILRVSGGAAVCL